MRDRTEASRVDVRSNARLTRGEISFGPALSLQSRRGWGEQQANPARNPAEAQECSSGHPDRIVPMSLVGITPITPQPACLISRVSLFAKADRDQCCVAATLCGGLPGQSCLAVGPPP